METQQDKPNLRGFTPAEYAEIRSRTIADRATRAAAEEEDARQRRRLWEPVPIPPQEALAGLYELVIARSEKRTPKWKFRFAPDLVVQMQAKVSKSTYLFQCVALRCEGANAKLITASDKAKLGDKPYWKVNFELRANEPGQWTFKARGIRWRRCFSQDGCYVLRDELIRALEIGILSRLSPAKMLSPHCLCCGKPLTDPVSMARFIGPECSGTGSDNLPFVRKLEEN